MPKVDINDPNSIAELAKACGVPVERLLAAIEMAGPSENDIRNHLQKTIFINTNIAAEKQKILAGRAPEDS